jgi:hypothetical protein
MNRNDFIDMIENTSPVSSRMISEVYELIDIFPYFQSAHLLLLKGLYSLADVKFENQLRHSAIHIGDREVLYWLLKTPNLTRTDKTDLKKDIDLKGKKVTDTHQTVIESAKNSEFMIDEIERSSADAEFSEKQDTDTHSTEHQVMIAAEPDNSEPAEIIVFLEENSTHSEDKVVYMDPGFSVSERSDLLELDLDDDHEVSYSPEETEDISPDKPVEYSGKRLQSDLIDKFIIANPRIEPQRDKTYLPNDDISKPFLEESGGLVTETLAKIYVNQGYYSKAIDIYEKLSLKFPEKSSYFASQIEKVKEYIKK